ncbi:MAG: hypothetical protein ACKVOU_04420 [Cytophagales bacterium]
MRNPSILYFSLFFSSFLGFSQLKKNEPQKGLELSLPATFTLMSDDDLAQKYPSYKKPIAMYESEDRNAEMGVNAAVNKWKNYNLGVIKDVYKSTISTIFTEVNFIQDGNIVDINDRKYVIFEFTSAIIDDKRVDNNPVSTRRYNYLAYTIYQKKILVFNFNSTFGSKSEWMPMAVQIMKSIKISDRLKIKEFEPYRAQGPRPTRVAGDKNKEQEALMKQNQLKK